MGTYLNKQGASLSSLIDLRFSFGFLQCCGEKNRARRATPPVPSCPLPHPSLSPAHAPGRALAREGRHRLRGRLLAGVHEEACDPFRTAAGALRRRRGENKTETCAAKKWGLVSKNGIWKPRKWLVAFWVLFKANQERFPKRDSHPHYTEMSQLAKSLNGNQQTR